ncbi:hypothetical protein NQZ79_g7137 [Umbelopsis isabellina]|nr:hypothetical protein NQZ79_g7137 [Umbelopsis isabellina]
MHTKIISLAILLAAATLQAVPLAKTDNDINIIGEPNEDVAKTRSQWAPNGLKARGEPDEDAAKTRSQWAPNGLKARGEPDEDVAETRP